MAAFSFLSQTFEFVNFDSRSTLFNLCKYLIFILENINHASIYPSSHFSPFTMEIQSKMCEKVNKASDERLQLLSQNLLQNIGRVHLWIRPSFYIRVGLKHTEKSFQYYVDREAGTIMLTKLLKTFEYFQIFFYFAIFSTFENRSKFKT